MLELRSIDAGYGRFQALFGIDLDVKAGEAVGVIGPNGAGKTTLMRVISGLIRPTKGSIRMQGTDVLATPAHRIVSLGIAHVPENRRLLPTATKSCASGSIVPLTLSLQRPRSVSGWIKQRSDPSSMHASPKRSIDTTRK